MPSTIILAPLMFFQTVDAADQGRFSGTGRSADDDPLLLYHSQVDALKHMEFTKPFVHIDDFDHALSFQRRCFSVF